MDQLILDSGEKLCEKGTFVSIILRTWAIAATFFDAPSSDTVCASKSFLRLLHGFNKQLFECNHIINVLNNNLLFTH